MLCRATWLCILASSPLLVVGCAVTTESDEDIVADSSSALRGDCTSVDSDSCDPTLDTTNSGIAFTFQVFGDTNGFYLTGTNVKGQTLTQTNARIASTTVFRSVNPILYPVDPIFPNDPITPQSLAIQYNSGATLGDSSGVISTITIMPTYGFKARVWLNKQNNTIRAFRPVY